MKQGEITTAQLQLALRYITAVAQSARLTHSPTHPRRWELTMLRPDGISPALVANQQVFRMLFLENNGPVMPVHHWEQLRTTDNAVARRYAQFRWALGASMSEALWNTRQVLDLLEPPDLPGTPLHMRDHSRDARRRGLDLFLYNLTGNEVYPNQLVVKN